MSSKKLLLWSDQMRIEISLDKLLRVNLVFIFLKIWSPKVFMLVVVSRFIPVLSREAGSYFYLSVISQGVRRIERHLLKHGNTNLKLTLLIMKAPVSWFDLRTMEQYYINNLPCNLNVDKDAFGSGYHGEMSEENRIKLRKDRGTSFFCYDVKSKTLLFIFDSIEEAININIHRSSLNNSLHLGDLYVGQILFSLVSISGYSNSLMSIEELKAFIDNLKKDWKITSHPHSIKIIAENITNPSLTKQFNSLNELSIALKGDRTTLRKYLFDPSFKGKLYRKQWRFTVSDD
uniref:LAGLIDADG endonuclease n=1 Tax=Powellomyces hirtus TaxID=109895 RepID=A0A4P8NQQ2_9FUNG|nr:hypothetical protein [Powellomyces hirtus]